MLSTKYVKMCINMWITKNVNLSLIVSQRFTSENVNSDLIIGVI